MRNVVENERLSFIFHSRVQFTPERRQHDTLYLIIVMRNLELAAGKKDCKGHCLRSPTPKVISNDMNSVFPPGGFSLTHH